MLQTEGFDSSKRVDPNMINKKVKGKETEVQDGWKGHIMPFELVQNTYLNEELQALKQQENRLSEISAEFDEIIDSMTEEEKSSTILNDKNDAFNKAETTKAVKEIYADVKNDEIDALEQYLVLLSNKAKKPDKLAFIQSNE